MGTLGKVEKPWKAAKDEKKGSLKREILRHTLVFGFTALLVFMDQMLKKMAEGEILGRVLIPHVLGLTLTENRGMAFGIAQGKGGFLLIFTAFALGVFIYLHVKARGKKDFLLREISLVLCMAGALGNALDRFFRGYVVDFLEFLFVSFPVFNLADVFVVTGVGLLALSLFLEEDG